MTPDGAHKYEGGDDGDPIIVIVQNTVVLKVYKV